MLDKAQITNSLKALGICSGDTLLIKVNLGAIGIINTKKRQDYLQAILDAIGEAGTLVTFAFTKSDRDNVFDGTNASYLGTFPNLMLDDPRAYRSKHPTNSFVAIGKHAKAILEDHNENSGAFEPIRKVIELNGKILTIGADALTPGFVTHLPEIDLGIHKRIIFPSFDKGFFKEGNKIKIFKRRDIGGCTAACHKFYGYYVAAEALKQGYVGNAYTLLINGKTAYDIDFNILKQDPKFTICAHPNCFKCRARRWDNLQDLPGFFIRKLYQKLKSRAHS